MMTIVPFRTLSLVLAFGVLAPALGACGPSMSCGHEIGVPILSPDGRRALALDAVNCGATTGLVTWMLVAQAGKPFNPSRDRIAVYEGVADSAEWLDDAAIRLGGNGSLFSVDDSDIRVLVPAQ